jgi:hypothetical protein
LPEDEAVRAVNHATDKERKKKKNVEKVEKKTWECVKLQHGKPLQGSDEEVVDDDDDDDNDVDEDDEEDDIPWNEVARDDEGSSSQPLTLAHVPPSPTPTPTLQGEDAHAKATDVGCDTHRLVLCRWGVPNDSVLKRWSWGRGP